MENVYAKPLNMKYPARLAQFIIVIVQSVEGGMDLHLEPEHPSIKLNSSG
jgi:hypothetical protein